jgi:hypothetical protein
VIILGNQMHEQMEEAPGSNQSMWSTTPTEAKMGMGSMSVAASKDREAGY